MSDPYENTSKSNTHFVSLGIPYGGHPGNVHHLKGGTWGTPYAEQLPVTSGGPTAPPPRASFVRGKTSQNLDQYNKLLQLGGVHSPHPPGAF